MGRLDLKTMRLSGKIGPVVAYYTKDGKQILRIHTVPRDPKTPKQLASRMRFSIVTKALSPLNRFIKIGHRDIADANAYHNITSHMLKHGVNGEYPNLYINYSEVKMSEGNLQLPANITLEMDDKAQAVRFTWNPEVFIDNPQKVNGTNINREDDRAIIVCLDEKTKKAVCKFNAAERRDGEATVDFREIFEMEGVYKTNGIHQIIFPENLHFWIYLRSRDMGDSSVSGYARQIISE